MSQDEAGVRVVGIDPRTRVKKLNNGGYLEYPRITRPVVRDLSVTLGLYSLQVKENQNSHVFRLPRERGGSAP